MQNGPRSRLSCYGRTWLPAWLVIGMGLRLAAWGRFPLREDEALYGTWARLIASGQDPMLERVAVDKPPFFIYSLAHAFESFGASVSVGRGLNEFCSLLAMVLLWLLARRLYGARTAAIALALFALSPFAISFAPTLYTDPMLVAWLLLALLWASYGLGLGAGLALGMAFATKQTGLLFIPLVLALLLAAPIPSFPHRLTATRTGAVLWRLLGASTGFGFVWYKIWQWDGWRILPAEIPSFWQQSWHSYGGLTLVAVQMWPQRLAEWWGVWRWLGGWVPGTLVLALLCGLVIWKLSVHRRAGWVSDLLILSFTLAYLSLHVFFSFQTWDRYLLGLAPLLALLAARGLQIGWAQLAARPRHQLGLITLLLAVLVWGGVQAAWARIPVGGDHGAYSGIETVAAYLHEKVPADHGVLYQRWLGWQWNWYLDDSPAGRVYWADPAMLVADVQRHPHGYTRFIVFPAWHDGERPAVVAALAAIHQRLAPRLFVAPQADGAPRFAVYQIIPETTP
ncbi:MAG: hypothetical protein GXP37_02320 [Chloroflexi bacterium]|nr:hypothetical protein [Chloroflexota bacterium]